MVAGAVLLALGAGLAPLAGAVSPQPAASAAFAGPAFADVAARVKPAVVAVVAQGKAEASGGRHHQFLPEFPEDSPFGEMFRRFFQERAPSGERETRSMGSGFIIAPDGWIVTNAHVIDGAREVDVVLDDGTRYTAQIRGRDAKTDLAVLKIEPRQPLPHVSLGDSGQARVGDWVLAVGNPFGLGGSVTAGIVSARGRDIQSGPFDDFLQIDAPINRGNSGGPLFDAQGQVIGINTAILSPTGGNVGVGFAMPAELARPVVERLMAHGRVDRGWLGVQIQSLTPELLEGLGVKDERGALVAGVVPGGPAEKAGVRVGDLITAVDGKPLAGFKDLPRLVAAAQPGARAALTVLRQGKPEEIQVVLGQAPEEEPVAAAAPADPDSLGLAVAPITPDARSRYRLSDEAQGVLVVGVTQGGPAARAGIRPGSVISMVGQEPVSTPEDLAREVKQAAVERRGSVLLLVDSGEDRRFVAVRFAT
jgi:serine protease Do